MARLMLNRLAAAKPFVIFFSPLPRLCKFPRLIETIIGYQKAEAVECYQVWLCKPDKGAEGSRRKLVQGDDRAKESNVYVSNGFQKSSESTNGQSVATETEFDDA